SKIVGATDLTGGESCTGGSPGTPDGVNKRSFGGQTNCGNPSHHPGANRTNTFSYKTPNTPDACACMTSNLPHNTNGNNSNNDIIDNGAKDMSASGPAGFAFVDTNGQPINTCGCPTTTTTSTTTSTTSTTSTTTSTTTTTTTTTSTTTSTTTTSTTTTS